MKICIITCYNQPDYIRARTLRAAAASIDGVEVLEVKNTNKGVLRYPEVFMKVLKARLNERPDAYLLTFRGYEMLLPVRLLSLGKPLIYDEFINPIEWVSYEHKKIGRNNPLTLVLHVYYRLLLKSTSLILTDTESHADLSAAMMKVKREKYLTLPVATDEATFKKQSKKATTKEFTVFYYGNMLPLHGIKYVIDAATQLAKEPVRFVIIGGSLSVEALVAEAIRNGAHIEYKPWVEYDELAGYMNRADLCLAGPFGGTFQSNYVITGKAYQYLAMGRPTVVGENYESGVFTDKQNALVVPQQDVEALVEAVKYAMAHKSELAAIGDGGQKLYKEKFSVKNVATGLEAKLRALDLL